MKLRKLLIGLLILTFIISLSPLHFAQGPSPIILSNVELVTVDEDYVAITWVTNLPANTIVQWGESEDLGFEDVVDESVSYHMGKISGLKEGTTYYYRVGSGGRFSEISSFTTLTPTEGNLKLKYAIVADSHYDADGRNNANGYMYGDSPRILESFVQEINQDSSIEFVMTLGDLTNGAEEDFDGFVNTMDGLEIPWYPLLGNADKSDPNWANYYYNSTGRDETYYSINSGGFHIIILDSAVYDQTYGTIDDVQFTWLEDELEANGDMPILIFMHHLVDRTDNFGVDEDTKNKLETLLESRSNVLSLYSGHLHQNVITIGAQGQELITVAATSTYPIGYSIVRLYAKGYTQSFHKIESELEASEESRLRITTSSGNPNADDEYLGTLDDRSIVVPVPEKPVNQQPKIDSIILNPSSILPGETSIVSVTAMDPNGDSLTYEYETTGGYIEGTGVLVTYYAPLIPGDYTISVMVFDGELYSERKSIDIEVRKPELNSAPELKKVEQSATNVKPNEVIIITVTAVDLDEDKLTYHYAASAGTISGIGSEVDWEAPEYSGEFSIEVWVSDGELESNKKTINVYVIEKEKSEDNPWSVPGFEIITILVAFCIITIVLKLKNLRS